MKLSWCLLSMATTLGRKEANAADFTVEMFTNKRDGTPSWVTTALMMRATVLHLHTLVDNVAKVDEPLSEKLRACVLEFFSNPRVYDEKFPSTTPADEDDAEKDDAEIDLEGGEAEENAIDTYMEDLRSSMPVAAVNLADVLRKLYDGGYEDSMSLLSQQKEPGTFLAVEADDKNLGQLGKDLKDLMRSLHAAESVISGKSGAPAAGLRELTRRVSDGADATQAADERNQVWQRATTQRKKLVSFGIVKDPTKATSYAEIFKKAGVARAFKGVLNESHRLFVFSADLQTETGGTPWSTQCEVIKPRLAAALEFMCSQRDVADVKVCFDGCNRPARSEIESTMMELPGAAEIFVVYDKPPNTWVTRKNVLSARNIEVGFLAYPANRTKMKVKKRGEGGFGWSGETSSFFNSYSGVPMQSRMSLPMISVADKQKLLNDTTEELPPKWVSECAGVPVFWMETKSVDFWKQIIADTDCKCVVDLTPGSGSLATACMSEGVNYFGMVNHPMHLQWLTSALDRAAIKSIATVGKFLYQEDLATLLNDLFSDIINADDVITDDAVAISDDEEP